jgi:hypothetical protein
VDGKQRLMAVFEFTTGSFPVAEECPLIHLRGKYFEQFSRDEKTLFWTYQFPIEYLPTNEETIINAIFQRINKNTARLTRQELRHARFGGLFIAASEELSEEMSKILPEGFPRLETQSRKQMKDVELVANLLLSLEEGIRGYSQDELDASFSEREQEWDKAAEVRNRFNQAMASIRDLCANPTDPPLHKTRLRNQADFYSLFTAVDASAQTGGTFSSSEMTSRLADFVARVEDEQRRAESPAAMDYFSAARSNSNDTGPRKKRHEIILKVLDGTVNDYASSNPE